jgi:transaldolase
MSILGNSLFKSRIKIYSDGADRGAMLEMAKNPKISGITTNPSLMKKAGVKNYKEFCLDILKEIKEKPLSFEVFTDDIKDMKRQAMEIKTWASNVYVKIPVMNTEGHSTMGLVEELSHSGVKLNITAILTLDQVKDTCAAVKGGAASIVSVFAGRVADTGRDPMPLMSAASELCLAAGPQVECLWASTREVYNIVQAEQAGCHIITVPPDIIKKMSGFNKDLWEVSLDTVKTFKTDSESAGFQL